MVEEVVEEKPFVKGRSLSEPEQGVAVAGKSLLLIGKRTNQQLDAALEAKRSLTGEAAKAKREEERVK